MQPEYVALLIAEGRRQRVAIRELTPGYLARVILRPPKNIAQIWGPVSLVHSRSIRQVSDLAGVPTLWQR